MGEGGEEEEEGDGVFGGGCGCLVVVGWLEGCRTQNLENKFVGEDVDESVVSREGGKGSVAEGDPSPCSVLSPCRRRRDRLVNRL